YIRPEEECSPDDLVIVSVKSNQLEEAIKDIKNHVGKDTIIISLLNGITSEENIGRVYGMEKMLYSICIGDSVRKGNVVEFSDVCRICFGERINRDYSERVHAVKELFDKAKIPCDIPENMIHSLWKKFMINVGINQASAINRGTYGTFHVKKESRELMESAMWEVIRLSEKVGVNLSKEEINNCYKLLDTVNPEARTSMCQDIMSGRKTEVDIFAGTVCKLGEEFNIDTPVNRRLFNFIKAIEQ
ncbi:MAG: 2-dehydropantoate 2-reductase, partial [Clostridiaceae bacterium]